jgi:hypothetical protein
MMFNLTQKETSSSSAGQINEKNQHTVHETLVTDMHISPENCQKGPSKMRWRALIDYH